MQLVFLSLCLLIGLGLGMELGVFHYNATLYKLSAKHGPGAKCLDGSDAAYYYRPSSSGDTTKWIIALEGAGWCYTLEDCYTRSGSDLGTSANYPGFLDGTDFKGIMTPKCSTNPMFCNHSLVFVKSCDGSAFMGHRDEPISVNNRQLYFRGKPIWQGVLHSLAKTHKEFLNADTVILAGTAAVLIADSFQQALQAHVPGVTTFRAVGISSYYTDAPNVLSMPVFSSQIQSIADISNMTSSFNPQCIAKYSTNNETWKCALLPYALPFISTQSFIIQSMLDSWHASCILTAMPVVNPLSNGNCSAVPGYANCGSNVGQCSPQLFAPMIQYWNDIKKSIEDVLASSRPGHGGFFHSCFAHGAAMSSSAWKSFTVQNTTIRDAVAQWMNGNTTKGGVAQTTPNTWWDCEPQSTLPHECNPTCF